MNENENSVGRYESWLDDRLKSSGGGISLKTISNKDKNIIQSANGDQVPPQKEELNGVGSGKPRSEAR